MAVSIIPRPSLLPPTSDLPLLPVPKVRKSLPASSEESSLPPSTQPSSKLALRTTPKTVKPPASPTPNSNSTPSIPTLRYLSTNPEQGTSPLEKDIRRSVSIASFPQPPKIGRRTPIDFKASPSIPSAALKPYRQSSEGSSSSRISTGSIRLRSKKLTAEQPSYLYNSSDTPTLLNGSGEGKSISGAAGARGSDGLTSAFSPSQSRSSSAQGSYSTSATTFEDVDENMRRAREDAEARAKSSKRQSTSKEVKGNVIVSVRVRPDASGAGDHKSDGEWMVDGRRSLVAHRGRERGEYYYGRPFVGQSTAT